MKSKPKIYHDTNKQFNNNKKVFLSYLEKNKSNELDIRKKINNIFNSKDFIYRTKVNIKIDNQIIEKKIIGIKNNNLLTIDNELIPIDTIEDIYKK